jgi:hypothetical protein
MNLRDKTTRELMEELHYWQARVRMDIHSLERTRAKCKEVAGRLRARRKYIKACQAEKQKGK